MEPKAGSKSLYSLQLWWILLKKGIGYQDNQTMSCPNVRCEAAAEDTMLEGRRVQGSSHEEVWKEEGSDLSHRGREAWRKAPDRTKPSLS